MDLLTKRRSFRFMARLQSLRWRASDAKRDAMAEM